MSANVKCVIVGSGCTGKTCILDRFLNDKFTNDSFIPTVNEVRNTSIIVDGQTIEVQLVDTADFERVRPLCYPDTQIILICFSLDRMNTLERVIDYWVPELQHHSPSTSSILVGTKLDLRDSREISAGEGERVQKMIPNCIKYMECSAASGEGIKEVFEAAVREALKAEAKKEKKKQCAVM
ncbi:ras-related protein Rac1-like isoform X2 [Convolutriloba macropyga]|uniref:ras-related protein Rac1-like isoform X2 n=1 Tax=Convolutriloba macropyga TaxID=536237 RepID=UPI003F527B51